MTAKKASKGVNPRTGKLTIKDGDPEPAVEIHMAGTDKYIHTPQDTEVEKIAITDKPITFFSRFREDELLMETSRRVQVGPDKWVVEPARVIKFHDRAFVTNDQEKIDHIRQHGRFGFELFEFGNDKHKDRIEQIDDSGRILELEKQGRLSRIMESRIRVGAAS